MKYEYIEMKYVYIGSGPDKKAKHEGHLKSSRPMENPVCCLLQASVSCAIETDLRVFDMSLKASTVLTGVQSPEARAITSTVSAGHSPTEPGVTKNTPCFGYRYRNHRIATKLI